MARRKPSLKRVKPGIYQRPSGKFVVPVYDPVAGKKLWSHPEMPRGGFDELEDAERFKGEREKEKVRGTVETCGSFARRWPRDFPRKATTTNDHHRDRVKAFIRDFDDVPMDKCSRPMARLWIHGGIAPAHLEQVARHWHGVVREDGGWRVPEHKQNYKQVRAMYNDAIDSELPGLSKNPFSGLKVPEGKGRSGDQIILLTEEEIYGEEGLIAEAEVQWGDYGRHVIGPMIAVGANGLRPGENYALRRTWVDWDEDEIHVKRQLITKTGKEELPGRSVRRKRIMTLLPQTRNWLKLVPPQVGEHQDRFWYTPRPRDEKHRMSQRTFWYYWNPVRRSFWAKLPKSRRQEIPIDFDFYELRHYFGTYLGSIGVMPWDIADQMGHDDGGELAMAIYIHTRSKESRDRVKHMVREANVKRTAAPPQRRRQAG